MSTPKPRIRLAEPEDFSPAALARLRELGEVIAQPCASAELFAALADCDVFWFRLAHRIGADQLGDLPRCRILATPVTGLDHIDLDACAARHVRVISLRGEVEFLRTVRATAELTVGLTLALLRHIPAASSSVERGQWLRDHFRGRELFGKRAGLVGAGRLGCLVADLFQAFGMEVIAFDPRPDLPPNVRRAATLEELFSSSDVISIHASYQTTTHHLITAELMSRCRPGAVLVNTSRAGIIDEQALIGALEAGHLAGATVDVLDGEPDVPSNHPLIEYARIHDNLLIVPHIGGNTYESFEKTELFLVERVARALSEIERGS